eukprot:CAMPEP_0119388954 /NCGR_PEP_ID=MMETSP1334-20130426/107168_1 /TAXON_ID=127549 /ORGANISM="Calcidiscus leptoporus, Strain RCC1130" /LENGTH=144 /DNA_ID=CAMNT_0007411081 /DNA_START=52 /DNA_END=485 /DNA_ORIENTATION=+
MAKRLLESASSAPSTASPVAAGMLSSEKHELLSDGETDAGRGGASKCSHSPSAPALLFSIRRARAAAIATYDMLSCEQHLGLRAVRPVEADARVQTDRRLVGIASRDHQADILLLAKLQPVQEQLPPDLHPTALRNNPDEVDVE